MGLPRTWTRIVTWKARRRTTDIDTLYARAGGMGLRVEEDCLPRGMNGYYCDALGLIVLHDKLNARQRLCTLQHELIHAHYHDIGCGGIAGLKAELRARRETALTLISPVEYRLAEATYDGEAYSMAVELGVTMQVLKDYRTLLEQRVRYGAEMVGQQSRDIPSHNPTISACVPMSERTSMGIKIGDKNTTGVFP